MKQRSQRGAARVSAVWLIVLLVCVFVAAAYGYIAHDAEKKASDAAEAARTAKVAAEEERDKEREVARAITGKMGFNDDTVGSVTEVDLAQSGLENLKATFGNLDDSTVTVEDMIPVIIAQYNSKLTEIQGLNGQIVGLQTEVSTVRDSIADITSAKDAEIRTLSSQLTDAENNARDDTSNFEGRIASLRDERDSKDADLRSSRGEFEDLERASQRAAETASARMNRMADKYLTIPKEGEKPDGVVLAVSPDLGIGFINLGTKNRLKSGMRFSVQSGKLDAAVKGYAEVIDTGETTSEVHFFDIVDPYYPIVQDDVLYNPIFDPSGERYAVLIGRFSGSMSEAKLKLLLNDIGITLQTKIDNDTDYLIVGAELYEDEEGEPYEEPVQPSELPEYKDAEAKGVKIVSIRELKSFFKK